MEDAGVTADGLIAVLHTEPSLEVVAAARTPAVLVAQTSDLDLAVLDLNLGDGSDPGDNVRFLRSKGIESLVFTGFTERHLARSAVEAGVLGLVKKDAPRDRVVAAIKAAAHGEFTITKEWAHAVDEVDVPLTDKEREILRYWAQGEPTRRAAQLAAITENTLNTHLSNIRKKVNHCGYEATTRAELSSVAYDLGITAPPASKRRPGK